MRKNGISDWGVLPKAYGAEPFRTIVKEENVSHGDDSKRDRKYVQYAHSPPVRIDEEPFILHT